jgi:hypothetical protein
VSLDRPTRSTTHRHRPFLQPLSYTPPRLRPAAKSPQLRIVPRCRHKRSAAPCCVCNVCAHLAPRSILIRLPILRPPVSPLQQGAHRSPFPSPRRARTAASHILLHRCAQRSSALCEHLRQPPTATARPPRPAAARFEPATLGRLPAGAAPAGAEPAGTTPLRSFSTASGPDTRSSSAPSACGG